MTNSTQLALGILTAAAAGACIDGAVAFQADEAQKVGRHHGLKVSLIVELIKKPQWLLATGGQAIGAGLQIFALTLAPLTVVQPTLALGLIVLLLVGAHRFDEHVGRKRWLAVMAMVAGVALLAVVAPEHSDTQPHTWQVAVVSVLLLIPMVVVRVRGEARSRAWQLIVGAGCGFALSAVAVKMVADALQNDDWLVAIVYGAVAAVGALGGQVLDMTALQRFAATHVAPPIFAMEIVLPVALAPWLFHEDWTQPLLVLLGLAIVVAAGITVASAPAVVHLQEEEAEKLAAERAGDGSGSGGDGLADEPEHDVRG